MRHNVSKYLNIRQSYDFFIVEQWNELIIVLLQAGGIPHFDA